MFTWQRYFFYLIPQNFFEKWVYRRFNYQMQLFINEKKTIYSCRKSNSNDIKVQVFR